MTSKHLNELEDAYYDRQIKLNEIGPTGQLKLKNSSVLVIGAGGLSSPVLQYFAAAGVGHIGCIDYDIIESSNLHRQVIHNYESLNQSKVDSVQTKIKQLNPFVDITTYNEMFTAGNAESIAKDYDIIIDGSDNFQTRYLVNDICIFLNKPYVYGSIHQHYGQMTLFSYKDGPCYRCLFPEPPKPNQIPNCEDAGVLGVLAGVIGSLQATEAIKLILGIGQPLVGRLLNYDALSMKFTEYTIEKNPDCDVCSDQPKITELQDYDLFCGYDDELTLSVQEFLSQQEEWQVFDIRTDSEIKHLTLPINTIAISLDDLKKEAHQLKKKKSVIICQSGNRSHAAAEYFRASGFPLIHSLKHGAVRLIHAINQQT